MSTVFYQFRRIFQGTGVSESFYDVLPATLTLTPQSWYNKSITIDIHSTMFKEVSVVPYKPTPVINNMLGVLGGANPSNAKNWHLEVFNTLKGVIEREWDDTKFHIVSCSSGFDSRILSYAISQLAQEKGKDWLGDILFVENCGESDLFKEVMKAEGWNKSQYMVYREEMLPEGQFEYGLTGDLPIYKFKGSCGFPYNLFYEGYDELFEKGVVPANAQIFSAYGTEIEYALNKWPQSIFFYKDYYMQMQLFKQKGDWIFPWYSLDYVRAISKFKDCYNIRTGKISEKINRNILPGNLSSIKRYRTHDMISSGQRTLPDRLLKMVQERYDNTEYGKKYPTRLTPALTYSNEWGRFSEAMICSYLTRKGFNIKIT